jgi:hypothetical protein
MKAAVTHGKKGDPAVASFKQVYGAGPGQVYHPETRAMIKALVSNLSSENKQRNKFIDSLDAEYSLSTGYAHGSQAVFLDVIDQSTPGVDVHPRTRTLTRVDELVRTITCILGTLSAVEVGFDVNLGGGAIVQDLNTIGPFSGQTSLGRHNALKALFGIL